MKNIFLILVLLFPIVASCQRDIGINSTYGGGNDTNAPRVIASTTAVSPVGGAITVTFTVTKRVTGFVVGDVDCGNCVASAFTDITFSPASNTIITVTATPLSNGTFTIAVAANKMQDSNNTNNTASNTLSLTYTAGAFTPSDVNPDLWLDMTNVFYTSSADNLGKIVDAVNSRDANHYSTTPISSGALNRKPSYNGEGIYMDGNMTGFSVGSTSTWKYLHGSGNAWTIEYQWNQLVNDVSSTPYHLFSTSGSTFSNGVKGIKLSYINSGTTANALRFIIYNGAGGAMPFDLTTSANSVVPSNWLGVGGLNTARITMTGTVLTISIKNSTYTSFTQVGIQTNGSPSLSSADSFSALFMGMDSNSGLSAKQYDRHLIIFMRSLTTSPDRNDTETYLAAQESTVITPTKVAVLIGGHGQSNMEGKALNADASGSIAAPTLLGGYWFRPYSTDESFPASSDPWWGQVQLGVHDNHNHTEHAWYAKFSYNRSTSGHPTYMVFAPRSSTALQKSTTSFNFSVTTPFDVFSHFHNVWKVAIRTGIYELIHIMRKEPEIRLRFSFQGEADNGIATQAQYLAESEARLSAELDYLISLGLDVSKIRSIDALIRSGAQTLVTSPTITNSSGDAIINATSHGRATGEWCVVSSSTDYDGLWYIEVTDANHFKLRPSSAGSFVAYVANRTPVIRLHGAINSAKLQQIDRNIETRIAGQHYVDCSAMSSDDGTHLNAVGSAACADAMAVIATLYQTE